MIRVINLSPAIDVTYFVGELLPGQTHRVQKIYRKAGGKGVNVANILLQGSFEVELLIPLGGESGDWIEGQLASTKINLKSVKIRNSTRTCVTVMDKQATVFNEPAAELTGDEFSQMLDHAALPVATTVISGSLPDNLTSTQLSVLFQTAKTASEILIVDSSGEALLLAASAGADLLKPNLAEALSATNSSTGTEAVKRLLELGAGRVLLSRGEQGLSLYEQTVISAYGETIAGNATGAGDAVTALAAIGLNENVPTLEWLRDAAAAGMLAVAEPTAGVIDWEKLSSMRERVEITEEKWL